MVTLLVAAALADEPQLEEAQRDRYVDAYVAPAQGTLEDARLALAFGAYDAARDLVIPMADANPGDPELSTLAGIAWMGTYYAKYGLSEAAFDRVQGAAVDPAGALAGGPLLAEDDLARALARGFAAPGAFAAVRGGSVTPSELTRARVAFDHAVALDASPASRLHQLVVEAEIARWGGVAPALPAHRAAIEEDLPSWTPDVQSLAHVDLGVVDVLAGDPASGLAHFLAAEALGSPLGMYDAALVYASVPALRDGAAATARFRSLGSADRAASAGLLPNATAWPLGGGRATLVTDDPAIAALSALAAGSGSAVTTRDLPDGTRVIATDGVAYAVVGAHQAAAPAFEPAVAVLDADEVSAGYTFADDLPVVALAERAPMRIPRGSGGGSGERRAERERGEASLAADAPEKPANEQAAAQPFEPPAPAPAVRVQVRTVASCAFVGADAPCATLLEVRPSE